MSSLSRKRGRSESPGPPLDREASKHGRHGSLSSLPSPATENTSTGTGLMEPAVATIQPNTTIDTPETSIKYQTWIPGGGPATTATPCASAVPAPPIGVALNFALQTTSASASIINPPFVVNNNNNVNHVLNGSVVNNTYNETNFVMHDPSSDVLQIIEKGLAKHHIPGALHDAQPPDAGCMEGTRVKLLDDTKQLLNTRGGAHIVWIAGMAGTGKTSVALTLCRALAQDPTIILGGTFFCSRSAGAVERTEVQHILPTFAVVLARKVTAYAEALAKELKEDPDLAHKSIHLQVKRLLINPLERLRSLDHQIVLVIDALDECSDERKLVELINALASFTSPAPVKFLFTSRPEMHIRETLISDTSLSSIIHLHNINLAHVTADIRLYVQKTFEKATSSSAWYMEGDVNELAALSGGLFIFASTAVAYILRRKTVSSRSERLNTVKMQTSNSLSTASLDKMYSLIITQASNPEALELTELNETRRIVAVILSTRVPLTLKCLAKLLGLTPEHLRGALDGLHAVIHVPEEDDEGEPRMLHASFGDFIQLRAPEYIRISKEYGHDELARGCLQRMTAADLCFNISGSETSYLANDYNELDWFCEHDEGEVNCIASSLVYACLHWAYHIDLASVRSSFDDKIESFLRLKLLFWLELLSIIDEVGRASSLLRIAASAATAENVLLFLRDAIYFVTSSHEAIERSAAHIYLSALPFTPKDSLVHQHFSKMFTGLPSVETFGIDHHDTQCKMVLVVGHSQEVTSVAYSPDGKILASGSNYSTVQLWDARSGAEIRELETSTVTTQFQWISCIAFTPDGLYLVAVTDNGNVFRWDVRTGRLLLQHLRQDTSNVTTIALSLDGGTIASAFEDSTIDIWSINIGQSVCGLLGRHEGPVWAMALSPDGKTFASSGSDDIVRLWDCRLGEPVREPLRHQNVVNFLVFSPDSAFLASGSWDKVVRIWDTQTGQQLHAYVGHKGWIKGVAFAPGGHALASVSEDCTVCMWDLRDGGHNIPSLVLRGHSAVINAVCFSSDGLSVTSCSADNTIRVWEIGGSYSLARPLDGHTAAISAVAVSGDSRFIASASDDGTVRVWDVHSCKQMYPPLPLSYPFSVTFSSDNRWIATGSGDMTVRLWDTHTCQITASELHGHKGPVNSVMFSPVGLNLASGSNDCTVRVWDVSIRQPAQILKMECSQDVNSVAYSPNGTFIVAVEAHGDGRIFDAVTGQYVLELFAAFSRLGAYAPVWPTLSPDGAYIVTPSDGSIIIIDVRTGATVSRAPCHSDDPEVPQVTLAAVAYSPDGRLIAASAISQQTFLWDANTMEFLRPVVSGHVGNIRSIVISPDSRFIVTNSSDKTVRIWDLEALMAIQRERSALASLLAAYKDGWLVSPTNELLLWVPLECRGYLEIKGLCRVIAQRRVVVTADNGLLHQGEQWTQCWRGGSSASV